MKRELVRFTVEWTQGLLEPKLRHALVARAIAQMPGATEGLTLYEVVQRLSPPMFAALFQPPIIGELYLAEVLTWERGDGILTLPNNTLGVCDESDCERVESDELGEG